MELKPRFLQMIEGMSVGELDSYRQVICQAIDPRTTPEKVKECMSFLQPLLEALIEYRQDAGIIPSGTYTRYQNR